MISALERVRFRTIGSSNEPSPCQNRLGFTIKTQSDLCAVYLIATEGFEVLIVAFILDLLGAIYTSYLFPQEMHGSAYSSGSGASSRARMAFPAPHEAKFAAAGE